MPRRGARCAVILHQGAVLLERRPPAGIWGGLLALPELPAEVDDAQAWSAQRFGLATAAPGRSRRSPRLHPLRARAAAAAAARHCHPRPGRRRRAVLAAAGAHAEPPCPRRCGASSTILAAPACSAQAAPRDLAPARAGNAPARLAAQVVNSAQAFFGIRPCSRRNCCRISSRLTMSSSSSSFCLASSGMGSSSM